jgi:uracil-DNA glycosylase family 4
MTDDWNDTYTCPICSSEDVVPPVGNPNSPILIIGAFPGDEEVKEGRPMVGRNGTILSDELRRCSVDMKRLRITNLWQHPKNENAGCLVHWGKAAIAEAKGKKAILLIGAETVKYFCGCSVEAYNGLLVKSDYLSVPIVMACIQPVNVFKGGLGEFRLSVEKFSYRIGDLL